MSTKYVLLGLLDIMPMSGYDLSQNFQISFNSFWAASYGQIYPTLHKLEEEGLIAGDRQARGKRAQRIVYSLTDEGRRAFRKWVNEPIDSLPFRDPFRLWASNLNMCDPEAIFHNIDKQIEDQTERAEYLEHTVENILNEKHSVDSGTCQAVTSGRSRKNQRGTCFCDSGVGPIGTIRDRKCAAYPAICGNGFF